MNRRAIALLGLVSLSMAAVANESTGVLRHAEPMNEYTDVLHKAEEMEDALGPMQMVSLALATTRNMKEAQRTCSERAGGMHNGMGVVFQIDGSGQVTRTWERNGSAYEGCFAATMSERIDYVPPQEPFYTAIDFGR